MPNKAKPQAKEGNESWNLQYRQATARGKREGRRQCYHCADVQGFVNMNEATARIKINGLLERQLGVSSLKGITLPTFSLSRESRSSHPTWTKLGMILRKQRRDS